MSSLGLNIEPAKAMKRADIVEYEYSKKPVMADISVIHSTPLCPENLKKFSKSRGAAARVKETQKISKYKSSAESLDMDFRPLVMETYGRLGEDALKYARGKIKEHIHQLTNGKEDRGMENRLTYKWWATLSCTLQKGNSNIINNRCYRIIDRSSRIPRMCSYEIGKFIENNDLHALTVGDCKLPRSVHTIMYF
jgi:hypothetical protein